MSITLSGFEVFTTLLSVVSLVFNYVQWRDHKQAREPIVNQLTALFNDIKTNQNNAMHLQKMLFAVANPHQEIGTLRWEYAHSLQGLIHNLSGLQEQVVALLVTMNPGDRSGAQVFKAQDYGLTALDIQLRDRNLKKLLDTENKEEAQANEVVVRGE